ncbi:MAG: hypothetical protein O9353_02140, partial [Bacteroidia bacterium]|nr:hypothetical protein [Bacteroidia bacterium]
NCGHLIAQAPSWFNWNTYTIDSIISAGIDVTSCTPEVEFCATYVPNPSTPSGNPSLPAQVCFTVSPAGCWQLTTTTSTSTQQKCGVDIGDRVNPFVYGIKGNWRPKVTWSYLEDRLQQVPSGSGNNNLDIRRDGTLSSYYPFYDLMNQGTVSNPNYQWIRDQSHWTYTSEVSKYIPYGAEVENKDALERYSSALYGYNASLPVAVASNARLQEIGYDGFEDYGPNYGRDCDIFGKEPHFDFSQYLPNVTTAQAHTGKKSIRVNSSNPLTISKKLIPAPCTTAVSNQLCNYILSCSDFIYPFSPVTYGPGVKRYVISYWVKEVDLAQNPNRVLSYGNSLVGLSLIGTGSLTMGSMRQSEIIDGWQRFEQDFTLSPGASGNLNISLKNNSLRVQAYFDDIRIHPFNSNMKSFVYDPVTL